MDVETYGFWLLPGFALKSFAAAVEPLRAANALAGRRLYKIRYFGEGETAAASVGVFTPLEAAPRRGAGLSAMFVCAGGRPADWRRPGVHRALRRLAGEGVRLGGISGGLMCWRRPGCWPGDALRCIGNMRRHSARPTPIFAPSPPVS